MTTFADCPQAKYHGNPFRYCACGWNDLLHTPAPAGLIDELPSSASLRRERDEARAEVERLREALRDVERCADGNASPERLRRIVADALAPAATGERGPDV